MERPKQAGRIRQTTGILACSVGILVLVVAAYRVLVLTIADWHFRAANLPHIESAERLLPGDATYHYARALAVQQTDPTSPEVDKELATALALNPRFSDAMLSWSVDKEFNGDKRGAEKLLMNAIHADRQLRPSWALANFYYRQGDTAHFWPQARECLRLIALAGYTTGRYDPAPIFQLCWSMQADAATILANAVPQDQRIQEIYLNYLISKGRVDAEEGVAARMLPTATADDMWVLVPYINSLIAAGRAETAVRDWNVLIDRKLLPYQPLEPSKGVSLTDGSFQSGPSGVGFDWRTVYPDPIRFSFLEHDHTYRFEFDGSEPAEVNLLSQTLPLLPNRRYRLASKYRADFDAEVSGLTWLIRVDYKPLAARPVGSSVAGEKNMVVEFQTPAQATIGTILLHYSRAVGTTFIRGPFELLQTSLTVQ